MRPKKRANLLQNMSVSVLSSSTTENKPLRGKKNLVGQNTTPAPETQQPSKTMSIIRALLTAGLTLGRASAVSTQAAATDTAVCFW